MNGKAPGETRDFKSGSVMPKLSDQVPTIFSMRFCPFAERTRLILTTKHIPYEVINIDLKSKPEWFLQLNPLGLVPVLEEQGKKPLFDSLIVAEYLDDQYVGDKKFLPDDFHARALQKIKVELISQKIIAGMRPAVVKNEFANLRKELEEVQDMLTEDYFSGKSMGFVDLMVWPWFARMDALAEVSCGAFEFHSDKYPKLKSWVGRMLSDPDIKSTVQPTEYFVGYIKGVRDDKLEGNIGLN